MIDNIIETNRWNVPIHFAVTVSEDNRVYKGKPIDDHLEMNGMMYRLKKESGQDMVDVTGTSNLYLNVFKYRGVADSTVYKDENAARLTNNYAAGFLYAADMAKKGGDIPKAIELMNASLNTVPGQWQSYAYLMQLYADLDSLDRVEEIARKAPAGVDVKPMWLTLSNSYWQKNQKQRAYNVLKELMQSDPEYKNAYSQLLNYYYQDREYDSLESMIKTWLASHPDDSSGHEALAELQRLKSLDTSITGVRVKQVDLPPDSH
jgi:tetratricopeptide (TPR) repeat protein